ncbi:MAG: hypothetical protein QF615_12165 [Planctomycetota bacterium]|nr:hypothetical protein [Planctomycetota bacterium]
MEQSNAARKSTLLISRALGAPVELSYSRARSAPVRATRNHDGSWRLRLHAFFAGASPEVLEDLAAWLRSGRRARSACKRLDAFIDSSLAALPPPSRRRPNLSTKGTVHDLAELARPLLATTFAADFQATPAPRITWGRRGRSRARHTLRLGTYTQADHLVRIHPVLDRTHVPAWVVSFVLHHELLHAALDQGHSSTGRRIHHGPAFKARERSQRDYQRALAWEKKNLGRLIRAARAGTEAVVSDINPARTAKPQEPLDKSGGLATRIRTALFSWS